jgi:DNA-binding protein HU-beta
VNDRQKSGSAPGLRAISAVSRQYLQQGIDSMAKAAAVTKKPAKTPAKAAAKATTIDQVGTRDMADHLATAFEIPRSHAQDYISEIVSLMTKTLKKGQKVRISGLGVFQVRKRAARTGRNPQTGTAMKIKASKRVVFATARDLKEKL